MLSSIHIENIAIMDNVNLDFENGFCVLTGETGAGKSIIIDSINLLTGERSSRELVRSGRDKAVVEGAVFTEDPEVYHMLEENGIPFEEGEPLILCREVNKDGRSIVRINGRISTTGFLKGLCSRLINIHGQNDNQAILDLEFHGKFLDLFAGNSQLLEQYRQFYEQAKQVRSDLERQDADDAMKEQKKEFLTFQIGEIQQAALKPGEDEELSELRVRFLNNEKIDKSLQEGFYALTGNETEPGAYELIEKAQASMEVLAQFERKASGLAEKLDEIKYTLDDVVEEIRNIKDQEELEGIDINFIENRIDVINRLKKKYGSSIEEILEKQKQMQLELDQIEHEDEYRGCLQQKLEELERKRNESAQILTEARKKAGKKLSQLVAGELADLDMEKVKFEVQVDPAEYTAKGADRVEFLISTNSGEPMKPLNKIASGGELSRIILSLKVVLADTDGVETMIFDEVDTGVSGRAAQKIAEKLKKLSQNKQVFVITHLAQIAAFADTHYLIEKKQIGDKTQSMVTSLDYEGRVREIARIISGTVVTEHAVETAKEMLSLNHAAACE